MTQLDVLFCKGFLPTNIENVFCTDSSGASSKILKTNNDRFIMQFDQYCKKGLMVRTSDGQRAIPMSYFEIFVQYVSVKQPVFAVGLAKPNYDRGMVGWYDESIGYHADDGFVFHNVGNQHNTENYIDLYSVGDIIGVLLVGPKVYFTKNGMINNKPFEMKNFGQDTYLPTLSSSDSDTTIKVLRPNEFKADINKFIKEVLKFDLVESEIPQRNVNNCATEMLDHCDTLKNLIHEVMQQQTMNDSMQRQKDTEIEKLKMELTELQSTNDKLRQQNESLSSENTKLKDLKTRFTLNTQDVNNLSLEQLKDLSRTLLDTQNTLHSKEKDLLDVELLCVVCQDNRKNTLFLPCKHLCVCGDCSTSVKICPVCRSIITDTIQTHI